MPPRRRGRPRINPQDRDRQEDEPIRESAEAQASVVGSPSIAAPSVTPVVDPNLTEAVAALAKAIPTLSAPAERRIVDYCKDLKNMGCKAFTGLLKSELAWSWLQKMEMTFVTLQIPETMRVPCAVQFLEDHAHTWWKTTVMRYDGRPTLTWADFRKEFEEKYYSRTLRDKKWKEF